MKIVPFVFIILSLIGCHQKPPTHKLQPLERGMVKVTPLTEDSKVEGLVTFTETKEGTQVRAILEGLPPGKHGFHVHEFGDLGNEGNDAGSHYNPNNTKHGFLPKEGLTGAHAGDFGNIEADEEGNVTFELFIPGVFLTGEKNSIAGRSIIIHEKEDDFGQPVGNAGRRIGGGTIFIVK